MKTIAVVICNLLLVFAAVGCASFPGEWLEEGTVNANGSVSPVEGERRAALRFEWPSTVRYGAYDNLARVVDHQAVQTDTYFTMQWGTMAQFGATKARVKGDTLDAYIGGDITRRFRRVKGNSIFPPAVIVPSLAKHQPRPIDPLFQPVEPVYASTADRGGGVE
jgi:hypothetical protein